MGTRELFGQFSNMLRVTWLIVTCSAGVFLVEANSHLEFLEQRKVEEKIIFLPSGSVIGMQVVVVGKGGGGGLEIHLLSFLTPITAHTISNMAVW